MLWKTSYRKQKDLEKKEGAEKNTSENRHYFLGMLEDYKGSYEKRIRKLEKENFDAKNKVSYCFTELYR